MSKVRTEAELSDQLQLDRTWRIKEISDIRSAAAIADTQAQRALLRAFVAICYAHWEGSVRFSARRYLEYVAVRRLRYGDLDKQFWRNCFLPRLSSIAISQIGMRERCRLLDGIISADNMRFTRVNDDLVNTRSNLNSEVFRDICLICGVDISLFDGDMEFIDIFLVKRRNEIAHGEDVRVGMDEVDDYRDRTLRLIRTFANELENKVYLGTYKTS